MSRRHRFTPIFLLVLLVIGSLLAVVPQEAGAVGIYSEDFESTSPPGIPAGWTDTSQSTGTFEVDTDYAYAGTNAIRSEVNGYPVWPSSYEGDGYYDFGAQTGVDVEISFRWLVDSDDGGNVCEGVDPECHQHLIGVGDDEAGYEIAGFGLRGGDLIRYRDWNAWWPSTGVTIVYRQWYLVRILTDFATETYTLWIDGVEIVNDAGMQPASDAVRWFSISSWQSEDPGGQLPASNWVDNLTISTDGALAITSTAVTAGTIDTAYSYDADSNEGIETETWSFLLSWEWLSIDSGTGVISGTPTVGGYYNVIVQVATASETATQDFNISVGGTIAITSSPTLTAVVGSSYSENAASNYRSNETWACDVCPSWLTIDSGTGVASGTPTETGDVSVTISVDTDIAGDDGPATQSYTITVGGGGGGNYRIITGEVEADPADFDWYWGAYPDFDPEDPEDEPPAECNPTSLTMTFQDKTAVEGSVLSYIWDFGDGTPITTSGSSIVVHTFPEFGEYTITLALMLSDGSIFKQEQTLKLGECVPLFLGEPIQNIMAGIIASAVVLWMTFILTRRRPVMIGALLATLIGVSGWSLLLGF